MYLWVELNCAQHKPPSAACVVATDVLLALQGYSPLQIYRALQARSVHLEMPAGCDPDWASMIGRCVNPNPAARPTMAELGRLVQRIMERQQLQHELWAGHLQLQQMQQELQLQRVDPLPIALLPPYIICNCPDTSSGRKCRMSRFGNCLCSRVRHHPHPLSHHCHLARCTGCQLDNCSSSSDRHSASTCLRLAISS